MDPLRLCIALGPLAAYLMVLAIVNIRPKPFLTTGSRDLFSLALSMVGLMVVGPMSLFMPAAAAGYFGVYIWLLMVGMYFLLITSVILMQRPRLVIYNISIEKLKPLLREATLNIDEDARWTGETIMMPNASIHLVIENAPSLRNVQLKSVGYKQNLLAWIRLRIALTFALNKEQGDTNPYGYLLLSIACFLFFMISYQLFSKSDLIQIALQELMLK